MDEREELDFVDFVDLLDPVDLRHQETIDLLRHAFEELKEIRDSHKDQYARLMERCPIHDRIQELIWKIGRQLGEF